jgi:hypothetical protein
VGFAEKLIVPVPIFILVALIVVPPKVLVEPDCAAVIDAKELVEPILPDIVELPVKVIEPAPLLPDVLSIAPENPILLASVKAQPLAVTLRLDKFTATLNVAEPPAR